MRLVAWNILHGGGTRRTPEIALRLAELEPDLVVLTEFRRTTGGQIAGVLHDQGLKSQLSTNPDAGRNGVLIASRVAIEPLAPAPAEAFRNRWLDVSIPDLGVSLTGVHAPDARRSDAERMQRQAHFWQHLVRLGQARRAARHLVAGDLNTGRNRLDERGETLTGGWFLGRLSTLGYRDAFRLVKPSEPGATWTSHTGSGYRIDGVWVSRSLRESVRDVWHHDEARIGGVSDHAPVVADFEGVFQGFFDPAALRKSKNPAKTGVRALAAPKRVR